MAAITPELKQIKDVSMPSCGLPVNYMYALLLQNQLKIDRINKRNDQKRPPVKLISHRALFFWQYEITN
jgi:hypothetical protein